MTIITSFDTETTGLDFPFGARPFMVMISTSKDVDLTVKYDEHPEYDTEYVTWRVDPTNREVQCDPDELREIIHQLENAECLVGHNIKFDCHAIDYLAADYGLTVNWPWDRMHDTMCSAHLLSSGSHKNLTDQCIKWLGLDVAPFEDKIKLATEKARSICRNANFRELYGPFDLANADHPLMPSAKGSSWKADMWLPMELACMMLEGIIPPDRLTFEKGGWKYTSGTKKNLRQDIPEEHPFLTAIQDYALADAETTLLLFIAHQRKIVERGLEAIYKTRSRVAYLAYDLENMGVTLSESRLSTDQERYKERTILLTERCRRLVGQPTLELPKSGTNRRLKELLTGDPDYEPEEGKEYTKWEAFNLPTINTTTTNNVSYDSDSLKAWLYLSDRGTRQHRFLEALIEYRKRQTALSYMSSYGKYFIPAGNDALEDEYRLFSGLNPFGTRTLRWSSSNPNEQNISKKEGFNLRYSFGPISGRGWASFDYENLELRIPAYESGEQSIITLFEHPEEPPYYGSNHLLNFSTVYPDLWERALQAVGRNETKVADYIKSQWKSTWYQNVKNGGFAVQYGSVDTDDPNRLSTADRAFGRKGCHALLKSRFSALTALNNWCIDRANKLGYVDTMPNLNVDKDKGYPLEVEQDQYGRVKPTQPLNTRVQGTACWVISEAMALVSDYYNTVNKKLRLTGPREGFYITMQVHDELVIDFPLKTNYKRVLKETQRLMESVGGFFNVPLKVGCTLHLDNWSTGVDI